MRPLRCILVAAARCGLGRVVLRLWVLAATEALGRWLATAGGALRARGVIARSVSGSDPCSRHKPKACVEFSSSLGSFQCPKTEQAESACRPPGQDGVVKCSRLNSAAQRPARSGWGRRWPARRAARSSGALLRLRGGRAAASVCAWRAAETSVAHACEVGAGKLARAPCRGGWCQVGVL